MSLKNMCQKCKILEVSEEFEDGSLLCSCCASSKISDRDML